MKDKVFVSLENTIGIREFMEVYLGIPYTREGNITHERMADFLIEHGYSLPETVAVKNITTSKVLSGEILLVRAENSSRDCVDFKSKRGKLLAYRNPIREKFASRLLAELQNGTYVDKLIPDPGFEFKKGRNNKYNK